MNSSSIGQKHFESQDEKNVGCPGSKSKVKDKNRFILNKEIVEEIKIVEISKDNVPSTVNVLRAGK